METIDTTLSIAECSFKALTEKAPIRIPKIQRDYAQGRKNDVANDIRSKFVHSLVNAVCNKESLEMDFIYGNNNRDAFEPLDGQQRLTTLFLLHWMIGRDLFNAQKDEAIMSYETRNSSKDFCRELVQHSAAVLREEIAEKAKTRSNSIKCAKDAISTLDQEYEDKEDKDYQEKMKDAIKALKAATDIQIPSFSDLILKRGWFNYLWQYDPTIQSMLVMIDAIEAEFESRSYIDETTSEVVKLDIASLNKNLENITFSYLNLGDFGLSDELFIKMNARGKQLSSYDITKSTLEEEIQIQKKEQHCDEELEGRWRSFIDGEWIDWFWNMFAAPEIGEITADPKEYATRLQAARDCEEKLKRLILRTIALDLQRRADLDDSLMSASYKDAIGNLNRLMTIYQDSLRKERKDGAVASKGKLIDFDTVIKNICCLYYKDNDDYFKSIFDIIPKEYNINEGKQSLSSLDFMLGEEAPNDCKVIFYAIQQYLLVHPIQLTGSSIEENKGTPEEKWKKDFIDWAHFCRNLFINTNNNDQIDKDYKFSGALKGVDEAIKTLNEFLKNDQITDKSTISFIASLSGKTIVGIDNQSLFEEVKKADLKLSEELKWEDRINTAEKTPYLWGQIRCLLDWSNGDISKFDSYKEKLSAILSAEDKNLVYTSMIWVYPYHGFTTEKLFQFWNKHRDYSIKRYLRDEEIKAKSGFYAPAIKELIDRWDNDYPGLSINDFLLKAADDMKTEPKSYRRCLIIKPELLNEAWDKMIYKHKDHFVLAQKRTTSSHCYDIALLYLKYAMDGNGHFDKVHHYDSFGVAHQYALTFENGGVKYMVQAEDQGTYTLTSGEQIIQQLASEKELLEYFDTTYSIS